MHFVRAVDPFLDIRHASPRSGNHQAYQVSGVPPEANLVCRPRSYPDCRISKSLSTFANKHSPVDMGDSSKPLRYVDVCSRPLDQGSQRLTFLMLQIGINLSDPMFHGTYHGKKAHDDDLDDVIQRAKDVGCSKFMVTGSDLVESAEAVNIARKYRESAFVRY